jgi:alginate O-acetyltransferase complex protein AlgI
VPLIQAALPVGISFYTFQSMSYTIDVYRREVTPARSFVDFATFVALFPQLIAGPIVRYSVVADQLVQRRHEPNRIASGLAIFSLGLAKKLLVADTLALEADPIFARGSPGILDAWGSMLLYAGQIYFDFSGYSDMAIGLGRLFGFELPVNFAAPYRARSFSDFWRRWHITLSTWLRDYLYVPLGGNRRGRGRTYLNLLLTMMLGGLWHGASWNFLLWGTGHGLLLAIERALGPKNPLLRLPGWLQSSIVFGLVVLLWVPFRLDSPAAVGVWLSAMLLGAGGLGHLEPTAVLAIALFVVLALVPKPGLEWRFQPNGRGLAVTTGLFLAALLVGYGRLSTSPFLYFRF